MKIRIEKDTMGQVEVPADKYWGAQTQRSKDNFKIGKGTMPIEIVQAFAILKKAAALSNTELGVLPKEKSEIMVPVLPFEELEEYIQKKQIQFGIISVPDFAAQQVCQIMVNVGIKGILNFAPIRLKVPGDCVIRNINLETELENIIYFVNAANKEGKQQ